ncbi:MAG: hypothetical protein KGI60_04885, partial [Patescibacteria group bacterium]|nr:hypothetical protein [Patescibacteria group bacterium]
VDKPSQWFTRLIYKEGEFICDFLAENYKNRGDVITHIFEDMQHMSFEDAFRKETGDTLEEFQKKLDHEIERRYSPIRSRIDVADEAKSLTQGVLLAADGNFFLTREYRWGRKTIVLYWTNGTDVESKKLVSSGYLKSTNIRGLDIEVLPEFGFQEHGASFASTTTVVYAMEVGAHDVIVVQHFTFDQKKKKLHLGDKTAYAIDGMRDLQHPVMIDDHTVAFVGSPDGVFTELYTYDLKTNALKQLTNDQGNCQSLTYAKAAHVLVTSIENEKTDSYDLASYDLKTDSFTYLTQTPEDEFWPVASPDGSSILYDTSKGLVFNVNRYDLRTHRVATLTNAKVGIFRPQWFGGNGMAFNSYAFAAGGVMDVKIAPLTTSTMSAIAVSTQPPHVLEDDPLVQKLKAKIPDVQNKTIFDVALSSDKTRAVFVENRALSMDVLKKDEPEVRFYIVDTSTNPPLSFFIKGFNKMSMFGDVQILKGDNLLLEQHETAIQERQIPTEEGSHPFQEDVTYKYWSIYNWKTKKLSDMDTESSGMVEGSDHAFSLMSPDRKYILWGYNDKNRLVTYNILTTQKALLPHTFYNMQDAKFVSTDTIMVLDKKWDYSLYRVSVTTDTSQHWKVLDAKMVQDGKDVVWYPIEHGKKSFFIVPLKNDTLNIYLFDTEKATTTLVMSEVPLVKDSEMKDDVLTLMIAGPFGQKRQIKIDGSGTAKIADQSFIYTLPKDTETVSSQPLVTPHQWDLHSSIPSRKGKLRKIPQIEHIYGAGGFGFSSHDGFSYYLVLEEIAYDDINQHALSSSIYLQEGNQGFADIEYDNFNKDRSYFLDYWKLDSSGYTANVGAIQDLFLNEFLNWDVTFKQQQVRNRRDDVDINWWRSVFGTSLSLDTTIWDCEANQWACHGPQSGTSIFTGSEVGVDNQKGFQTLNLNLDARYHLPITDRSGLAFRALAGHSFGPNPTIFMWGGNDTFRGITNFSQAGTVYAMQSTEIRIPILDAAGAVLSGPVGHGFAPLTVYFDIRGGVYNDIGDMWYDGDPVFDGHRGFHYQESAGYFINIPTMFGVNLRMNKGFYGKKDWNFWLGYNW